MSQEMTLDPVQGQLDKSPAKGAPKKRSQWLEVWHRLKRDKMAMLGLLIITLVVLAAIFADVIADYETVVIAQNLSDRLQGPSAQYWLGTDEFGRDIFARIIHGTRVSLMVGVLSVAIAIVMGGGLGAVAGYYGGKIDNVIMRVMDIFLAVPSILLAIAIVSALGANLMNLMLAIAISSVPTYARVVRASVLTIRDQEFIEAARAIGASDLRIIFRHIIPNCLSPVIVQGALGVAGAILSTAGLSFIGLGIQPPEPEWGAMLAGGRQYLRHAWHVTTFPGLTIMITILALNLLGDGLRDALDPRLKH
ncbi:nickel transporter permease [Endozoicomonas sp. GU-1]|uniref:nickel transporter permease n=1 Tax=Endozoicomonas sp. GU-1 TaxID=3009078 RepID=UPI0022B339E7|nr:nickel transporter permease [Endozoicomonas sp. GU-1]WBA81276.1 ABC transporter permease [Endozoicomonas sp. GU-1]WBA84221.1 ABC transporter permease [Endozoicomonas sp. GU-1]